MDFRFTDRQEAGRFLAGRLLRYAQNAQVIVLALPRGGVPVGYQVAEALYAPFDVFLVRKLELPWHRELAIGAIASGGVRVLNTEVIRLLNVPEDVIEEETRREWEELQRREIAYRDGRPPLDVSGLIVIVVDDGLATGASVRAAVTALRLQQAARIVVGVPVGSQDACAEFENDVDEVVCTMMPESFTAVSEWYQDFSPTTDEEVQGFLQQAAMTEAAHFEKG
jgi:putative phosphoribosyl transferase